MEQLETITFSNSLKINDLENRMNKMEACSISATKFTLVTVSIFTIGYYFGRRNYKKALKEGIREGQKAERNNKITDIF